MPLTAGQTTGAAVIEAAKAKADMQSSGFISDAEWLTYVQLSHQELYDLLIQAYGEDWATQSPATGYTFTTDGAASHYALPSDFYRLLGVDLLLTGSGETATYATLKRFNFGERNRYTSLTTANWFGRTNLRYRLNGNTIWLQPLPASGITIRLWYAPRLTLVDGTGSETTDVIDGVSGWEEYVAVDAALKAKQKEESDCSILLAQKAALVERIEAAAENRDAGAPATVADTRREGFAGDGGDGWGW